MKMVQISFILFLAVSLLTGCGGQGEKTETNKRQSDFVIYYLDSEETRLVSQNYKPQENKGETLIRELLEAMGKKPKNISNKRVLTDKLTVNKIALARDGKLSLFFNDEYANLTSTSEILCRAAIVKTLCQVSDVDGVEFYVNEQPLMLPGSDKAVGFMTEENFIDNTGGETNFFHNTNMTLYFTNKNGNVLKEVAITVDYDGTVPMEQLIVERLIQGPESILNIDTQKIYPTVPKDTKLIKASVKEGICYVDFNEKFLDKLPDVTNEVAIYSIVDSLAEMSNVDKVQFTINGEQVKNYKENFAFDVPFTRNLDIIK